MAIEYKDINDFVKKSSISGLEKLPVSDTEFITPLQIVGGVTEQIESEGQNYIPRCSLEINGQINGRYDYFVSKDFIPVENGDTIVWNPGAANWGGYLGLYDSNKNFLTYYSANAVERTITLQTTGVAFIRAPFSMDNLANAKIVRNGVTVWEPTNKENGVKTNLQNLSNDVAALIGEINLPFVIQNGSPGNFNNTNEVLVRGEKTVVIPVTPGHKYKFICNKTPVSGSAFYFRPVTYTTVSPGTFLSDVVRVWSDNWNNYVENGGVFTINSSEVGLAIMITESTEPSSSGTYTPIREVDFVKGDIVIIDVTNSRFEKIDAEIGNIETILASI